MEKWPGFWKGHSMETTMKTCETARELLQTARYFVKQTNDACCIPCAEDPAKCCADVLRDIDNFLAQPEPAAPEQWSLPNSEGNYCAHHPDDPAHGSWCAKPEPSEEVELVKRLRAGEPCADMANKCRAMEARAGCICAEAADALERLAALLREAQESVSYQMQGMGS